MDYIITGFIFGLFGSMHCIGMCGPIAVALPGLNQGWNHVIGHRLMYNLGRVLTYALMGAVFGLFGAGLHLAGFQKTASIVTGIAMLMVAFFPRLNPDHWIHRVLPDFPGGLQKRIGGLFSSMSQTGGMKQSRKYGTFLSIGLLNGLLPCGFVYLAVAASLVTGSVGGGAIYMALFGLGTIPAMMVVSLSPRLITSETRGKMRKLFPYVVGMVGILLILRGMSLGIPFISPVIGESCH